MLWNSELTSSNMNTFITLIRDVWKGTFEELESDWRKNISKGKTWIQILDWDCFREARGCRSDCAFPHWVQVRGGRSARCGLTLVLQHIVLWALPRSWSWSWPQWARCGLTIFAASSRTITIVRNRWSMSYKKWQESLVLEVSKASLLAVLF